MSPKRITLVAILSAFLLLLAACGGGSDESSSSTGSEDASTVDAPESTAGPAATATPEPEPTPTSEPDPTATPEPEPTAPPEPTALPEPAYDFSGVDPVVSAFIDERELNGAGLIVVHKDDGVVHHDHWGVFNEDRISLIASSSKMITAGVLLHLQDQGVLDIDAPVADVADWGEGNPDITPAQLLSNSSGLVGLLPDPTYAPYICQYVPTGSLQDCAASIMNTEEDDEDITGPDVAFNYGGAQWQVAGGVAEAASGQSWAELITEIYVEPCGLDVLTFNNHFLQMASGFDYPVVFDSDPSQLPDTDNPNLEGGAYVTTGDYGKLLLMHLQGGMCGDTQVLSQESLDLMHGDRIAAAYNGDAWAADTGYGMGWWVDRESGYITDGGAYGSVPWLDLEDGYGAFLVIEADSGTGNELADQLYALVDDAVAARS